MNALQRIAHLGPGLLLAHLALTACNSSKAPGADTGGSGAGGSGAGGGSSGSSSSGSTGPGVSSSTGSGGASSSSSSGGASSSTGSGGVSSSSSSGGASSSSGSASSSASSSGGSNSSSSSSSGMPLSCTAPVAPTQTTTISDGSILNFVQIFAAGGQVLATPPLAPSKWLRWTGTGWSQESIPWPASLPAAVAQGGLSESIPLPSGKALLRVDQWLMTYDGASMSPALQLPALTDTRYAITQSSDGRYHVFHGTESGSVNELISNGSAGWLPDAPLPALGPINEVAATAIAGDRIVFAYTNAFYMPTDPVHVYVMSHPAGGLWTSAQDITPTWAVRAQGLHVFGPAGGGLVVGATGDTSVGAIWRSTDGVTFGNYENPGDSYVSSLGGTCLDNVVVVTGYQTWSNLIGWNGSAWSVLANRTLNYINSSRAVVLDDGRTFWALGESNQGEYLASP